MQSLFQVKTLRQMDAEAAAASAEQRQRPLVSGLAAHVKRRFEAMRDSRHELEQRMLSAMRQRNLEYEPDKLAEIRRMGGSEIYMGITSTKCRAATAWLRETLLGTGADKPWRIGATPIPELPTDAAEEIRRMMMAQLQAQIEMSGELPDPDVVRQMASQVRDQAIRSLKEEADRRVGRMETKMEDQLAEGGFLRAFNEALDDLATFPFAVLKGPVIRRRKTLKWDNGGLVTVDEIRPEWERVDPFRLYWAPWVTDINDGPVIEHHKLTRPDLEALIGVDGYSESAIRSVLAGFGGGGLRNDSRIESAKADAERRNLAHDDGNKDLVDAYQLWDTLPGSMLIEWGMDEAQVPDPQVSYPCEVWLVKNEVIRAVLNYDRLGRKPYFVTSYERIPGQVAGNGVSDLAKDSQDMCNAAARSLANNMGIASGPQVGVNISRMPVGEDLTQMFPWKIWQFKAADYNDPRPPVEFFQPSSNAQELMAVFERFSTRADEDTGLPRYMSGVSTPGVGRTSSGMAMMLSNAGKGIKQVVSNIDMDWIVPAIQRLYQHNQHYAVDEELIGDVNIVARGAASLVVKEAEAVRRNEFLQIVLNSPVAQQIVGIPGVAELLREAAQNLGGNVDRIVPPREQVLMQLQAQMAQPPAGQPPTGQPPAAPASNLLPDGAEAGGRSANIMSSRVTG